MLRCASSLRTHARTATTIISTAQPLLPRPAHQSPSSVSPRAHTTCARPLQWVVMRATQDNYEAQPSSPPPGSSSSSSPKDLFEPEFARELLEELGDQSQLGSRGEAWTAAQVAAVGLVLFAPFRATELTSVLGVVLLVGGLAAIALSLRDLGAALTPLPAPRTGSQLVTSGVYEYARHPMYGGLLAACLGLAAVTHDEARLLAAALLWLVLEQKVALEERLLVERYGAAYEDYQRTVRKLLPFLY